MIGYILSIFAALRETQLQHLEAFLASQSAAKPLTQVVAFRDKAWMNHFGESDLSSINALGLKAANWEQVTKLPIRSYDQQIRDHTQRQLVGVALGLSKSLP